jgi:hypothetical protein
MGTAQPRKDNNMKKRFIASLSAIFLAGGILAIAAPASAAVTLCNNGSPSGTNWLFQDFPSGNYLWWNGNFKGQMRAETGGSEMSLYLCAVTSSKVYYQIRITGSNNCLEYDGKDTAVIADTCTSSRASQVWYWGQGINIPYYNRYNGCKLFAGGNAGAKVNCNSNPSTNWQWNIVAA